MKDRHRRLNVRAHRTYFLAAPYFGLSIAVYVRSNRSRRLKSSSSTPCLMHLGQMPYKRGAAMHTIHKARSRG